MFFLGEDKSVSKRSSWLKRCKGFLSTSEPLPCPTTFASALAMDGLVFVVGLVVKITIQRQVMTTPLSGADPGGGARGPCPPPYKILDPPMPMVAYLLGSEIQFC